MILGQAADDLRRYNRFGVHYNLVADEIYRALSRIGDPYCEQYEPYIVAGLIAFDMDRMMGKGSGQKYDPDQRGFASRLRKRLSRMNELLGGLPDLGLGEIDLSSVGEAIAGVYNTLSEKGALSPDHQFHVGATKIVAEIRRPLRYTGPQLGLSGKRL